MKYKNNLKLILLYSVSFFIFLSIFSKISIYDTFGIFKNTSLIYLSIAFFFRIITLIIRADKWRWILSYLGLTITLKESIFLNLSSLPIRTLFPLKSGELIQALYLKRKKNFSIKKVIFSLIINVICDTFALLLYVLIGIIILKVNIFTLRGFWIFFIFLFFLILFLFTLFFKKRFILIYKYYRNILNVFGQIRFRKTLFLFFYSIISYLPIFLIYFFVFKSLNINILFKEVLLFIPILLILIQIPITISGFGAREALIIYFFSEYASQEILFAAGILISLVVYIIPVISGLFFQKKLLENLF